MPHIVSTLTNGVDFTGYRSDTKDLNIPTRTVTVKGGHRVADKNIFTPEGVVTQVTEDELEFLERHKSFQHFVDKHHMKVINRGTPNAEKVAADLKNDGDGSEQRTPGFYKKAADSIEESNNPDARFSLPKGFKAKKR